jgi:threonine dehydrogenase-like Zn-dependent dehydrogenase
VPCASVHEALARAHPVRAIDPTFIITHRLPLSEAARGYEMFNNKDGNCEKVVLSAA